MIIINKANLNDWRSLFSRRGLWADISAGAVVACVAIPLSLAIALASGVEPEAGLVTAIVAGIVCALFGGSPLTVSGPAAAMAVLIAAAVEEYGLAGLLVITLCCGILQVLTGLFGLGKLARFVPLPVIAGFTAGIGAIILIGQLPRALGLPAPDEAHTLKVILHIMNYIQAAHAPAVGLTLGTLFIIFMFPRFFPRIPAPLLAVIIPSFIAYYFHLPAETIGHVPHTLPLPRLPSFLNLDHLDLIDTIFVVYVLASLESLLSTSAVDKLAKGRPHDPNQELIGQGLGNIAVSFFGGIPATGVIARSALNVQAGAKTRRAAIFHALFLLAAVYLLATWMSQIPIAVLSAILISVALRMCHPREFLMFWRASHTEACIYAVTFFAILIMGLISGIQAGIVVALLISMVRLNQIKTRLRIGRHGPSVMIISGPLTFLSSHNFEKLQGKLQRIKSNTGLILDLSRVTVIDSSGADRLVKFIQDIKKMKIPVVIRGLAPACRKMLLSEEHHADILKLIATDEDEEFAILKQGESDSSYVDRLAYGVEQFTHQLKDKQKKLFKKLAVMQDPHTLFITCADSRINPNFITSTKPGELFVIRNMGNMISPFNVESTSDVGAALEFAAIILRIKDIVVCGHSGCGAIKELLTAGASNHKNLPCLSKWLTKNQTIKAQLSECITMDQAAKLNAVLQAENIKTHPLIQEKLAQKKIRLRVWFYDIGKSKLEEWNPLENVYETIASEEKHSLEERVKSGIQYQVPFDY
jgi:carbonic anhydrase